MSEAHDRLRQYLEQRRELGETEFVLDALSVEDALKVLTGREVTAARPMARSAEAGARPAAAAPPESVRTSPANKAAEAAAAGGDWREALRAVDAQPTDLSTPAILSKATLPPDASKSPSASGEPRVVGANSSPSGLEHLTTLDAVAAEIAKCTACELHKTKIKDVPGEGNPLARFVVVGEAPGQTEDEEGRPFVGKSGDLLTTILEAIGFKREDVFICNVLKHRPPGNRNPTAPEIEVCRPFLLRQLELLQPKVILAVGTFAAQTLLETDSPIGKLRGLEHRYHGIPLVATYHPAALLRNPNWKRPAWEDVQLARRIFDRP